jgi:heptosyltransferase I
MDGSMRVLIVKTSSMGDVIHTLPAISDAVQQIPNIKFDWLVEPMFQEIPAWHPGVAKVIVVALRKWRQNFIKSYSDGEIVQFWRALRANQYDLVIDAQGLLKSALLARCAKSNKYAGYNYASAREPIASFCYAKRAAVATDLHAINRLRLLFAAALNYKIDLNTPLNYGVVWRNFPTIKAPKPYLFLLHGTTWDTKHWPENHWQQLASIAGQHGYDCYVTGANDVQKARAAKLASNVATVKMLPHLSIKEAAMYLQGAAGVVAVDTGFAHLAAALQRPLVALYGPTDPKHVGVFGPSQLSMAANCKSKLSKSCGCLQNTAIFPACMASLTPEMVWEKIKVML